MSYQIRKATKRDIVGLAGIERAAETLFPEGRVPSTGGTYPSGGFARAMQNGLLVVAEVDQAVVGFAVCEEVERALHLYLLAVHPEHGNQGIGKSLVVRVIEESQHRGLAGVTLTTFEDLKWNGPFYRKLGFQVLATHETSAVLASTLSRERLAGMELRVAMLYRNTA